MQSSGESPAAPDLSEQEKQQAEEHTTISPGVVHEAVQRDGDEELARPLSALAWSGLAAGLAMGFSFATEGLLRRYLPDQPWRPLIVNLGYPVGFLMVILGRQQLFTENTLKAIIPLMARRDLKTFLLILRLWAVVLAANLAGAHIFAWFAGNTAAFSPEVQDSLRALAEETAAVSPGNAILRGIFAGWLIATIVWLLAAVEEGSIAIITILAYVVGVAGLTHIIAGSVEVLFLVMTGRLSWFAYLAGYMLPTLVGNIVGGVSLVSALNHAQVVSGSNRST